MNYAEKGKIEAPVMTSSAAELCLKRAHLIHEKAMSIRDLSAKLCPLRLETPSNSTKDSVSARTLPPYFEELNSTLERLNETLSDIYTIIDTVDI